MKCVGAKHLLILIGGEKEDIQRTPQSESSKKEERYQKNMRDESKDNAPDREATKGRLATFMDPVKDKHLMQVEDHPVFKFLNLPFNFRDCGHSVNVEMRHF